MAPSPISNSIILPWDWMGVKYSPVPSTRDSAHKKFGARSQCAFGGYLEASGIEPRLFQFRSYYNLYWVKAHNNNLYNDYANFYAKQAVYDGEVFSVPAPRSFLSSSINKFILESWTSSWNDCNTGLRVKRFFNNPKLNILPISKYLVHFLTNHGPFPAYLHRFNLLPSQNCLCGSSGDAEHYAFHCPFTSDHHLVNPSPNTLSTLLLIIVLFTIN
ncbi:RNase H domain-containing protein [Trichonephila clavipes]|nr:RNase H domain-containing protein [Trichonephila clavipes]